VADEKSDPIDAANQIIFLAFDLADAEIANLPGQIAVALNSPPVQDTIRKTLLDFAQSKAGSGGAVLSSADSQKLLAAIGTGVEGAASDNILVASGTATVAATPRRSSEPLTTQTPLDGRRPWRLVGDPLSITAHRRLRSARRP